MMILAGEERSSAQENSYAAELPVLPQTDGRAGMFAGVSHGRLFCMAGADFPAGLPWEGGNKKWYADIFMLQEDGLEWIKLDEWLPQALGYGVSASYNNKMIIVGGSNETGHTAATLALEWLEGRLLFTKYPALPHPLANMSGTRVGHLLMVAGGMRNPGSAPVQTCYLLDLNQPQAGWTILPAWPGPERIFPVCGAYNGKFYMFSGENTVLNAAGISQRHILQDGFCFTPDFRDGRWTGVWSRLADIPKGMSAGPSPAPLIDNRSFRFWGGVDRIAGLHKEPQTHPGILGTVLWYHPDTDSWDYDPGEPVAAGRVTLPTVIFNEYTYYVSGEVRPGIRTNKVSGVLNTTNQGR